MKCPALIVLTGLLGACQVTPSPADTQTAAAGDALKSGSPEWRGAKFVRDRCADCHSVDYGETSPLPDAPAFSAIANLPDLTRDKLAMWLRNHKNYPDEMYFEIPAERIDDISAYMLTLRRGEKTPEPNGLSP